MRRLSAQEFRAGGVRVVPHAVVRKGAYVAPNAVLMPSYVNIGAYVDSRQHGRYLGDGRLLRADRQERASVRRRRHRRRARAAAGEPTIIEDDCFIGARSEIVEGVIVEAGWVISMGVFIGQSTRIYDRTTGEILQGRVPAGSVVVSGTLPSADGRYSLYCAVIVKRVDAQTRAKISINELLRGVQ